MLRAGGGVGAPAPLAPRHARARVAPAGHRRPARRRQVGAGVELLRGVPEAAAAGAVGAVLRRVHQRERQLPAGVLQRDAGHQGAVGLRRGGAEAVQAARVAAGAAGLAGDGVDAGADGALPRRGGPGGRRPRPRARPQLAAAVLPGGGADGHHLLARRGAGHDARARLAVPGAGRDGPGVSGRGGGEVRPDPQVQADQPCPEERHPRAAPVQQPKRPAAASGRGVHPGEDGPEQGGEQLPDVPPSPGHDVVL
mmetsp:Transcript_3344/g.7370  ORF Transcript_3344/g.7370 Transcript_3344/m.7370 type:complete len:253 (-) Transcript_3344:1034-1792(-)